MRREQLGELVSLTTSVSSQRPTAEMPVVELIDLLRRDRELDEAAPVVSAEHFDAAVRYDTTVSLHPRHHTPREFAVGTALIARPLRLQFVLACILAFAGGFALTIPLWW